MERVYTVVDLWGAFLLRLGTGDYLDTWFLTAPLVVVMAAVYLTSARRLGRIGASLDWTIRSPEDLRVVRAAIQAHLRATAWRAAAWILGIALLLAARAIFHLRFEVALSHVIALVLLPGPAILYGRRFVDRFRRLEVEDPEARAVYEHWVTQWQGPHVALAPDTNSGGALSVSESSSGGLSRPST